MTEVQCSHRFVYVVLYEGVELSLAFYLGILRLIRTVEKFTLE